MEVYRKRTIVVGALFAALLVVAVFVWPSVLSWFFCVGAGLGLATQIRDLHALQQDDRVREKLRQQAHRVAVTLVEVRRETPDDGPNGYRVICRWRDPRTGVESVLGSDQFTDNPSERLKSVEITALIDPDDASRYLVEIPIPVDGPRMETFRAS